MTRFELELPRRFAIDFALSSDGDVITSGDVAGNDLNPAFLGWELVRGPEFVDERRWGNVYEFIMKSPDGRYWSGDYTIPDEGVGDSYCDEDVSLSEVQPVKKTVVQYVAAK